MLVFFTYQKKRIKTHPGLPLTFLLYYKMLGKTIDKNRPKKRLINYDLSNPYHHIESIHNCN